MKKYSTWPPSPQNLKLPSLRLYLKLSFYSVGWKLHNIKWNWKTFLNRLTSKYFILVFTSLKILSTNILKIKLFFKFPSIKKINKNSKNTAHLKDCSHVKTLGGELFVLNVLLKKKHGI